MNDTARWVRTKTLFRDALLQPEAGREAWLAAQCGGDRTLLAEITALLAARDKPADILDDGAAQALRQMGSIDSTPNFVDRRIGMYRLLRRIGEGGMGSVYLAERDDGEFRQRVALKLVRADFGNDDLRARFLRERRILAQLSHPHIAQLHDGGMTDDGAPYFTLEYVEGEAITDYCNARRLGVAARVRLMLQVCAAVAHAHRNLIVHRDLKPSNIFVTADGAVKLLDFGIAKLLEGDADGAETATHARMMTPEYASPEQVLGEPITTATDVYAIGVLLYELLSGRSPYARAYAGAISWSKAVVEEEPEPLHRALSRRVDTAPARETRASPKTAESIAAERGTVVNTLRRTLRGDLDRILQRALAKSPEARYATVGLLADDLSAYVEGRAISGGSRRYRARVFVKRHWLPLSATAALLLVIVIGSATVAWQARRAEHQAQTTLAVKDFLFGLFTAVDPTEAKGRIVSAHELLDRGAKTIGRNTTLDTEQQGEIEATLGRIYFQLGLYDQAKSLQESAALKLAAGAPPALLARAKRERAETLASQGDLKSADNLATQARAETDALPAADIADRVGALHALTLVTLSERDFARSKAIADAALVDLRAHPDADPRLLIRALRDSGSAEWGLQLVKESEADWRESIAVAEKFGDEDDFDLAKSRVNLALAMQAQSRYAEAAQLNEQVIKTSERLLGSDHPMTLRAKVDFALARLHMGYFAEAQAELERAVEDQRKKLGADHLSVAGSDINLGLAQLENGEVDAAEKTFREAMGIFEKKYGRDYQGVRIALGDLAQTHLAQHRLAEADAEMTELLAADAAANNEDLLNVIRMGDVRRAQQRFDEALALERPAIEAVGKKFGENSRLAARAHHYLALTLRDAGDVAGAESEFHAAMNSFAGYLQDGAHPTAADIRAELADVLKHQPGQHDEIIRLLTEAAAMREQFFGADDARTRQAQAALRDAKASKI